MTWTYIDTPYSDANPAPAIHNSEDCIEWCNHCALCGVGTLYGARCNEHYGVYPLSLKPADPSEWVTAPDGEEFRVGQCQGHAACPVARHEHGCYADDGKNCDHTDEHPQPNEQEQSDV